MIRMFARHDVTDYATWRRHYDAFDGERRALGVKAEAVYPSADGGADVTVTHDFESLEEAKALATSARLRDVMKEAGVTGSPTIWFTRLD